MLRLGIVGMGYIGGVHRAAAEALGPGVVRVTAVATQRPGQLAPPAAGVPPPRVYTNYEELLAAAPVDAVVIATPTHRHEEHVLMALAAGRHVLCEKPLALNAASAERMVRAAEAARVTFMVAQVLRFWPHYVRILEAVGAGELGTLRSLSASRLSAFPHRSPWFADPAKSGGGLLDLHIHDADFVYALLGPPAGLDCAAVASSSGAFDTVWSRWRYPSIVADLHGDLRMPDSWPLRASLRVVGERAALQYDFLAPGNVGAMSASRQELIEYPMSGPPRELAVAATDPFVQQMRYFLACAANGEAPQRCLPSDSLAVMHLMDATLASARDSIRR